MYYVHVENAWHSESSAHSMSTDRLRERWTLAASCTGERKYIPFVGYDCKPVICCSQDYHCIRKGCPKQILWYYCVQLLWVIIAVLRRHVRLKLACSLCSHDRKKYSRYVHGTKYYILKGWQNGQTRSTVYAYGSSTVLPRVLAVFSPVLGTRSPSFTLTSRVFFSKYCQHITRTQEYAPPNNTARFIFYYEYTYRYTFSSQCFME